MDARTLDSWKSSYSTPQHADSIGPDELRHAARAPGERLDAPQRGEADRQIARAQLAREAERVWTRQHHVADAPRMAARERRGRRTGPQAPPQPVSLDMLDHHARLVADAVARGLQAPDQVDVLSVAQRHVEARELAADDQRRARDVGHVAPGPHVERRAAAAERPHARRDGGDARVVEVPRERLDPPGRRNA